MTIGGLDWERDPGRGDTTAAATVLVETARGDELVAARRAAPPTALKIDVEGFEPEVPTGLAATLREHPRICVESSPHRRDSGLPRDTTVRMLEALGNELRVIERDRDGRPRERPLRAGDLDLDQNLAAHPRAGGASHA